MLHKKLFIGALLIAGTCLLQAADADPDPMLAATPRAKVLATTGASRPFLAAARTQQAVDLAARGYAESEVAVSGHIIGAQPWATRMLVRRPRDAARFSGRVIVELLDASAQFESAPLWGFSWEYFLRRGDAWIGVTTSAAAVDALRKFSAARYGSLMLAPGEAGCGMQGEGVPGNVVAQVGALLRSSSKENPLLGLNPQRVIAAGYAGGGDHVTGVATTVHRMLKLGDGSPVFDGFLNVSGLAGVSPACVAALPPGVPFVSVLNERDIPRMPDRASGDPQSAGQRVYEIAGVAGARPLPAGTPTAADLASTGLAAPATGCREPIMDQAFALALNAIWQQLDDLVARDMPMTTLPAIEPGPGASGGWRLPQIEWPLAGPPAAGGGPGAPQSCTAATGSMSRFNAATLKQRYGSRSEYLRQLNAAVDVAITDRLLVAEDATAIKAAAARNTPAF